VKIEINLKKTTINVQAAGDETNSDAAQLLMQLAETIETFAKRGDRKEDETQGE
jgi:hypothetical protein